MSPPSDPLRAVTHEDPYPYYATLVRTRPVAWDATLRGWVLASAGAVAEALAHPACVVRPPDEPVPRALAGTVAGEIFGRLARQTDGSAQRAARASAAAPLGAPDERAVEAVAGRETRRVLAEAGDGGLAPCLRRLAFEVPVRTVAGLLGIPDSQRAALVGWTRALVACFAPGADAERVRDGDASARELLAALAAPPGSTAVAGAQVERRVALANAVGLLVQAHDATAGLIGNSLVAMARRPEWWDAAARDAAVLRRVLREVVRHDAPVQNTRRWMVRDATVAGERMRRGDAILLLLAAANRDPAANDDADAFAPDRASPRAFTFGAGAHACVGERVAIAIAAGALGALLEAGDGPPGRDVVVGYAPSPNVRIPVDLRWPASESPAGAA